MTAFYIAARFSRRPEANALANKLQALGHTITSRWVRPEVDHVMPTGLSAQAEDAERCRFATEDCDDVIACDCMVSLMEEPRSNGRGGRHVEFGMALGLGKKLVIIGPRETVFHHLPNVSAYATADDYLRAVEREMADEHRTHGADSAIDDELEPASPLIAGRTLMEWAELARRDDCFERMVPSDLRMIVSHAILTGASAAGMGSQMLDMQQECISLRVALATARDQFKDYERQHRAKTEKPMSTEDFDATLAKAETNKRMAAMCQAGIDGSRRVAPSVEPEPGDAAATVKTIRAAAEGGMVDSIANGILAVSAGVSVER